MKMENRKSIIQVKIIKFKYEKGSSIIRDIVLGPFVVATTING